MDKSKRTGVSMSSLMYLALERHIQEQQVFPLIPEMVRQIEVLDLMKAGLKEGRSDGLDSEKASDRLDCPGSPK